MKENIVSSELAKLAKEKGFSVGNSLYYVKYHSDYDYIYDDDQNHPESNKKDDIRLKSNAYHKNSEKHYDISNEHFTLYEAPTLELIHKWLRENHNMFILVETTFENTGLYSSKWNSVIDVPFKRFHWTTDKYYIGDTYEEALERGLIEALKLIQ